MTRSGAIGWTNETRSEAVPPATDVIGEEGLGDAIIVGHGRSGTNWLLSMLNASAQTHCRNEPDEIADSLFARLESPWVDVERPEDFGARWDAALREGGLLYGERDPRSASPKNHQRLLTHPLGLQGLFLRPRVRSTLRAWLPAMRRGEWRVPTWLAARERLEQSMTVFKLTQTPGWAAWALRSRPATRVYHIVRHPGGFLASWRRRYLATQDERDVLRANIDRLHQVVDASPEWARQMPAPDEQGLVESELWYWRYATEVIEAAGRGAPGYLRLVYEDVAREPTEFAQRVYAHAGLAWTPRAAEEIGNAGMRSQSVAKAWHAQVDEDDRETIARVMETAPFASWWEPA